MIKFNANYVLAVNFLNVLYKSEPNKPVRLEDCVKPGEQIHFLEQVARKLRVAGLVRSVRGPGGGYVLAVEHDKLTSYNVFTALFNEKSYPGKLGFLYNEILKVMKSTSIFEEFP